MAVGLVADLVPGPDSSVIEDPVSFNGRAYFIVPVNYSGNGSPQSGIWRTGAGESGVEPVTPGFFTAPAVSNGSLWVAGRQSYPPLDQAMRLSPDGTLTAVTNYPNGVLGSTIKPEFVPLGGLTVFSAYVPQSGQQPDVRLLASRGTPATTVDLGPGGDGLVRSGPYVYYRGGGEDGRRLSRTDGTPAGTAAIEGTAVTGDWGSGPAMTDLNGSLVFLGTGPAPAGQEPVYGLWRTDGTAAGTALLRRFFSDIPAASPMAVMNGRVYFRAGERSEQSSLWSSDGTVAGTTPVAFDAPTDLHTAYPRDLTVMGDALYFINGPYSSNPVQLWKTDGSRAGTVQLTRLGRPGDRSGVLDILGVAGGKLYFAGDDGVTGSELYQTDGTVADTGRIADIWPGSLGSGPADAVTVGDRLVFRATDPDHGGELRVTDPADVPTPVVNGSISGIVFDDRNANGRQDEGEGPLAGQTVKLTGGDFGEVPAVRTTDAQGRYAFGDLPLGEYVIFHEPSDDRLSTYGGYNFIRLASGENVEGPNFGAAPAAIIAGSLFDDVDKDGVRDAGEPPLAGWTVYLDRDRTGTLTPTDLRAITDDAGEYDFGHLIAGTYVVREVRKGGTRATAPAGQYEVTVAADDVAAGLDFGNFVVAPVAGVTLIDADTERRVPGFELTDGARIDLATVGRRLNIRADLGAGPARSVRFNFDGNPDYRLENAAPYAIAGDSSGNYNAWTPTVGTHTLVVTPYQGRDGTGDRGQSLMLTFNVVDSSPAPRPLRINSGGGSYTDSTGNRFSADAGFLGGRARTAAVPISGTTDDSLYQSIRTGRSFVYSRGVPDGDYTLRLHFAETGLRSRGQRRFDVFAEGRAVLRNYDIVADAGAHRAVVKQANVTVRDGRIDLAFRGVVGEAVVSAVELIARPRVPAGPTALHVNAGDGRYTDTIGRTFEPDPGAGFDGGTALEDSFDVDGTEDDALFSSRRAGGHFSFHRAVAPGNYTLFLDFAEPDAGAAAGHRTFDVFAEGRQILDDFDVAKSAGGARKARAEAFNVRVADGSLDLDFRGVVGDAVVSAIVLLPTDIPAAAEPYSTDCMPEGARQAVSARNLRQIMQGANLWANEHKGRLPDDLPSLLAEEVRPWAFADPRATTNVPRGEMLPFVEDAAWIRATNDYVYLGAGMRYTTPGDEPVAYENPARVAGPIHVAFFDGHIELMPRDAAGALLGFDPAAPADGRPPVTPGDPDCRPDPGVLESRRDLNEQLVALFNYGNRNNGRFPAEVATLFKAAQPPDVNAFHNPRGRTAPPPAGMTVEQQAEWAQAGSDYVYLGTGRRYFGGGFEYVLAYENPAELRDGINVLTNDGRVEFREMRWAVESIRRSLALAQ